MDAPHNFAPNCVPSLKGSFFDDVELKWNYKEKSHGKGPMDGVGGTMKTIIFQANRALLLLIHLSSSIKPYWNLFHL